MKGKFSFTACAFILLTLTIGVSSGFAYDTDDIVYINEEDVDAELVNGWDCLYDYFVNRKKRERQQEWENEQREKELRLEEEKLKWENEQREKEYRLEEEKLKWEKWQWEKDHGEPVTCRTKKE
ncbi:MAG: hypothetical protein RR733_04830 [Victivallaceae bacterium]